MKKILILGFTKLAYMPYLNFYLDALKDEDVEIHILTWHRNQEPDIRLHDSKITVHSFLCPQLDEVPKARKIGSFIKYRRFAKSVIRQGKFERLIVLHTLPAVLIADALLGSFRNRFILDYRDYTYEDFAPFKAVIGQLTKASFATFVSSDAFRNALPELDKIYTSHNLLPDSLNHRHVRGESPRNSSPIRIAFWGFIRHEAINRQIIRALANDSRFQLHFYGREQQTAKNLKELVYRDGIDNVFFHGAYVPEDRYAFAARTDLLHNMYENDAGTQKAMGNKYYDGIVFRIPQLCTAGSYMGQRVEECGVGKAVDPYSPDFAETVRQWYNTISWECFHSRCDQETDRVVTELTSGYSHIRDFVR